MGGGDARGWSERNESRLLRGISAVFTANACLPLARSPQPLAVIEWGEMSNATRGWY